MTWHMPLWADFLDDDGNLYDGEDFDLEQPFTGSWQQRAVDEIIAEEEADDDDFEPF